MIGPLDLVKFGRVYAECIKARQETDPENYPVIDLSITPAMTAARMLSVVARSSVNRGGADWLKYNPAMKDAAKRFGIKTSQELRVLVVEAYERGGDTPTPEELKVAAL